MNTRLLAAMLLFTTLSLSCSHALKISNLQEYFSSPPIAQKSLKLGIMSNSNTDPQKSRYVESVVDALRKNTNVEQVIYPYNSAVHKDAVDAVVGIDVNPTYSGRGSNFLVNWPGFLIFAPAIWGYGYQAVVDAKVNINWPGSGQSQQLDIPTKYKFRQAEFDRTWTEISWLEVSVIALVGGVVFTQYDSDVTDEFIAKAAPSYGPYVANKIMGALLQ